jgi:hypothetical protein
VEDEDWDADDDDDAAEAEDVDDFRVANLVGLTGGGVGHILELGGVIIIPLLEPDGGGGGGIGNISKLVEKYLAK